MFPVLVSLGPFTLRTLSLFVMVAFIGAAFLFWRKAREEHYDELEVFDAFLLSSLMGLLGSRVAFIVFQFPAFGFDPLKWLNVFGHPGFNLFFGLGVAVVYLYRYADKKKWDVFEMVDFWVIGSSFGLAMLWLGMLMDGTSFGLATNLPWGVVFPGVFEQHHPVQLYFALFFLGLFYYLSWAEYRYRTFSWYRAGKNTAQTGYLSSVFIAATGFFSLLMSFIRPAQFVIGGLSLDVLIFGSMWVGGLVLLFNRSGRTLLPQPKRTSPFKVE